MAHSKSALKRWRQNERHRARNKSVRSAARTAVKSARAAIEVGGDDAGTTVRTAIGILDRATRHNVVHRNTASRHKSRLMRRMNRAAQPAAGAETPKRARRTSAKAAAKTRAKAPAKRATRTTKK